MTEQPDPDRQYVDPAGIAALDAEIAASKAKLPPTAGQLAPRAPGPVSRFEEQETFEECPEHGRWQASFAQQGGGFRWLPQCPTCAEEGRLRAALGRSGIPPRFKKLTLDTYRAELTGEKRAREAIGAYLADYDERGANGHCLILTGTTGTGKTHLACGLGLALIGRGHSVAHFTVLDMVRRWRESWAPGAAISEADVLAAFVDVDFLILEEIGRQKDTEAERGHLFEILDGRYVNNRPTLITSNYQLTGGGPSVERFLGHACFDRLFRNGCTHIAFDWASYSRR